MHQCRIPSRHKQLLLVRPKPHKMTAIAGSALLLVFVILGCDSSPNRTATNELQDAVAACLQAETQLTIEIDRVRNQLGNTDLTYLNDSTLVDILESVIADAKAIPGCPALWEVEETGDPKEQAQKLTAQAASMEQARVSVSLAGSDISDAVTAAWQGERDDARTGDFTLGDKDGYSYRVTFNARIDVSIDRTRGKPGNVLVLADLSGTEVIVTNTTNGKNAPGPSYIVLRPLYSSNPCALVDGFSCGLWEVKGTQYWSADYLPLGPGIHMFNGGNRSFGVDEVKETSVSMLGPSEWEVSENVSIELKRLLAEPSAWVMAHDPNFVTNDGLVCAYKADRQCLYGGSKSLGL